MKEPLRVRLAYVDEEDDDPVVLLDEGQDFKALFVEFNRLDTMYVHGEGDYTGFTDFMESKGVTIVDHTSHSVDWYC